MSLAAVIKVRKFLQFFLIVEMGSHQSPNLEGQTLTLNLIEKVESQEEGSTNQEQYYE
jgi:hypothetical protein